MTTVAVTGAGGFIGAWLCRELIQRGLTVRGIVAQLPSQPVTGVDYRVHQLGIGDLLDLAGVEILVHLAARAGGLLAQSSRHEEVFQANTAATLEVLTAADEVCSRVFLASSAVVYAPSTSPLKENSSLVGVADSPSGYAWAKVCDEVAGRWFGDRLEVVVGRFTNIYGPGGHGRGTVVHDLVERALTLADGDPLTVWGDGTAVRSFMYFEDAARLIADLATGDSTGAFNVDSGQPVTIGSLAQMVAGAVSPTMEVVFDTSKPDGQPFRVLDVTKVTELGFEARVGLSEGVGRLVEYERERLGKGRR